MDVLLLCFIQNEPFLDNIIHFFVFSDKIIQVVSVLDNIIHF